MTVSPDSVLIDQLRFSVSKSRVQDLDLILSPFEKRSVRQPHVFFSFHAATTLWRCR
jgi:hypothetical protein